LPKVSQIDLGSTVARVWFERPVPPGLVIERGAAGSGLSSHAVPAGALSYRMTGLPANRESVLVMRSGQARQEFRVQTFGTLRGIDGCVLDTTVFFSRIISLSVVQGPDRIVACWVREDFSQNRVCQVVERESRDEGETWSPIRTVLENLRSTAQVQLAKGGDGLVLVACEDDREGQRHHLMTRAWQSPIWRKLGTVASLPWLRLALVDCATPQVEAVYSMPEGICWNRWGFDRLPRALPNRRSWTTGVTLVPGLPGRAVLMLHGALPQARETARLFTAVGASPGELGGPCFRVEAITAPDEMVSQFSAVATTLGVTVAYTVNDKLRIRESSDGRRFTGPVAPAPVSDLDVRIPACCVLGDDVYVVCQGVSQIPDFRVQVLRKRPGNRAWEAVSRVLLMSPDVCDLRVVPLERRLLIFAGERMGGVLLLRLPLPPAAGQKPGRPR
jgi:hypothetical protein